MEFDCGRLNVRLYGPGRPMVVCAVLSREDSQALAGSIADLPVSLVAVDGADWNRDLTPWPAGNIFAGRPDFGGGAAELLSAWTEEILPRAEALLGVRSPVRLIVGYSLAGLFALWAGMTCGRFDGVASVSGSMWYDGLHDFLRTAACVPRYAFFSVGDREKRSRNPAFASIDTATQAAAEILRARGTDAVFRHNPGGHFDDPVGRQARAVRWLAEKIKSDSEVRK